MNELPNDIIVEIISKLNTKQLEKLVIVPLFNKLITQNLIEKSLNIGYPRIKAIIDGADFIKGDIRDGYIYDGYNFIKCGNCLPIQFRILENNIPFDYWSNCKLDINLDISPYRKQILASLNNNDRHYEAYFDSYHILFYDYEENIIEILTTENIISFSYGDEKELVYQMRDLFYVLN